MPGDMLSGGCGDLSLICRPWSRMGMWMSCQSQVGSRSPFVAAVSLQLPFFFSPRSCLLRSWSFLSAPLCPLPVLPTHCGLCQLVSAAASTGPWNVCRRHHRRACLDFAPRERRPLAVSRCISIPKTQNWKLVHSGMDSLKLKRNCSSKIDGDHAGIFEESENIWKGRDALKLSRYWCKNSTWSFVAERPGKEFKNMADETVVTRRRRVRYQEFRRHNLIHIYFQLPGDEERTSKNW